MNDWLTKFFAVFTMYKTSRDSDEFQGIDETTDGTACPLCGGRGPPYDIEEEERECSLCGPHFSGKKD